ncbi:MAG: GNAT family N-acetyltransferase [Steroidobacteraceae bacterium]
MSADSVKLIHCSSERHAPAILDILNEAIVNSTALYEYRPLVSDSMGPWFRAKEEGGFPVLGMESEAGELMGFATYGTFRTRPAYKYSVEHSVYVQAQHRGKGVGGALMRELIRTATEQDLHAMVGGIDAENAGSIAFHRRLGFEHAGTLRQVGYKFGRWLDLAFYQLVLASPAAPTED